uniref:Pentatricopeptide repeat-containing protein n=1 Tax=Kalanchoe fedtschenkoi TaxID=63787 RepID=A0A7N0TWA9_KALFE
MTANAMVSLTEMTSSITELHQIHAHMLKTSLIHHNFAASRLIAAIVAHHQSLPYAHSILTRAPTPNSYMYNSVIRGYANGPTPQTSFAILCQMLLSSSAVPDKYSYTFALKGCASFEGLEEGQQLHGHVLKIGIGCDVYIQNTLIHLYARCGWFEAARHLLDEMPHRDVISWNAMLSAYVELGMMDEARSLFDEMGDRDSESWNFMISGYVRDGLIEEARAIFDDMPMKNVVSWNSMITGYAHANLFNEVLFLFEDMQNAGMKADDFTVVNVLSACARTGALSQGEWVHAHIKKNGMKVAGFVGTALVDMYSKCGKIEKALEAFEGTAKKDISTWNSIISGLSLHGLGEHALHIFSRMLADGVQPNEGSQDQTICRALWMHDRFAG